MGGSGGGDGGGGADLGWVRVFLHVLTTSMANFLFGYHIGCLDWRVPFLSTTVAGINGVLYFSSLTFRDVGITSGILASLYVGITNFRGVIVASNLMDKQGRKKLLIGSYLGMVLICLLEEEEGPQHQVLGAITRGIASLHIFIFVLGLVHVVFCATTILLGVAKYICKDKFLLHMIMFVDDKFLLHMTMFVDDKFLLHIICLFNYMFLDRCNDGVVI